MGPDASPRALRAGAVLLLGLASCVSLSLDELDDLNRSLDVETIVIQERFTLYSPFEHGLTEPWLEAIAEELARVADVLQLDVDGPPIAVLLEPAVDLAPEESPTDVPLLPPQGLLGWAQGDTIVVRVASPAGGARGRFAELGEPALYRNTLRHELAHAFARRQGLVGERWFSEGLAEFVEALVPGPRGLERGGTPEDIARLGALPRSRRALADTLDWTDEDPTLAEQPPTRALAHAFVRYLLRDVERAEWIEALDAMSTARRSELLAREADWQTWLEESPHEREEED